jgi:hypothetical protein
MVKYGLGRCPAHIWSRPESHGATIHPVLGEPHDPTSESLSLDSGLPTKDLLNLHVNIPPHPEILH